MPDDWKTPTKPRLIGHMTDASGHSVAFLVVGGDSIIRRSGQEIRLGAAERDRFIRLFMDAEREIEAWTAEQAGASDA